MKPTQEKVTMGDSTTVTEHERGMACLATAKGKDLNLEDCLYIPQFDRNIISLGRVASKGHRIEMTESWIKVWSLNEKEFLKFIREGSLYYLTASPRKESEDEKGDSESCKLSGKGVKWKSMMHMYCWDTLVRRYLRRAQNLSVGN